MPLLRLRGLPKTFLAAAAAAAAGLASALLVGGHSGATTGLLPVTVVQQTATTLILGWTPPAGTAGYEFTVDGKRVSNTWNPDPTWACPTSVRNMACVKFAVAPGHSYGVTEVVEGVAGSVTVTTSGTTTTAPGTTTTSPATTTAPTTTSTTTTSAAPTFASETAYTLTPPPFTVQRDVPVSTAAQLQSAVASIQCGDRVHATAAITVSSEWQITARPSCPAVIDLTGVTMAYTGSSALPSVWINGASNLRLFGGDIHGPAKGQPGAGGISIYTASNILWWGFHVHDVAHDGLDVFPIGGPDDNLDLAGEIDHWGGYIQDDPHAEKGTGFHGVNIADAGTDTVTNSRFAFDVHDGPSGAGVEIGGGSSSGRIAGITLYLKAVNLTMAATSQVAGNAIQWWGAIPIQMGIPYLEASNLQGRATDGQGVYSGVSMSGINIAYGRATATNLNPALASTEGGIAPSNPWDSRHGEQYGDIGQGAPAATTTSTPSTTTAAATTTTAPTGSTTSGPTYYVSAAGSDTNTGTSPGSPWKSISKANAAVQSGSTVVLTGTFTRQAIAPARSGTATAPITYTAGQGGATLDQPGLVGATPYVAYFGGRSYVTVSGIAFTNSAYTTAPVTNKGVVLRGSNHITISGCSFDHMQMQLIGSDDNTIAGNTWRYFVARYVNGQPQTAGDMLNIMLGSDRNLVSGNTMSYAGHSLIEIGNGTGATDVNAANQISGNTLSNPWYKDLILSDDGQGTVASGNQLLDANSAPALYSTVPGQVGQLQMSSAAVQFSGENFTLSGNTISNAVCTYGCVTLGSRWYVDSLHPNGVLVESMNNVVSGNSFTGNHGAASVSFVEFLSAQDIAAGRTTVPRLTGNRVASNTFSGNAGTRYSWNGQTGYTTFVYHSATQAPPWQGFNHNTVTGNTFDAAGNGNLLDVTYGGKTTHLVQSLAQFEAASLGDVYANSP